MKKQVAGFTSLRFTGYKKLDWFTQRHHAFTSEENLCNGKLGDRRVELTARKDWQLCGTVGMVDDVDFDNLSGRIGNFRLDGVKFGGTPTWTIPSEARKGTCRDLTAPT